MSDPDDTQTQKACGIVMPISPFADYTSEHWADVKETIGRAIERAGFGPIPVWEHTSTDIIQGRIVKNLYDLPIIVCDVSGLNPNVMFEVGLRTAFAKPMILIVDDQTRLPFDTNSVEHLKYDSKLPYIETGEFVDKLAERIVSVFQQNETGDYLPFLKSFGAFLSYDPAPEKARVDEHIVARLDDLSYQILLIKNDSRDVRRFLLEPHNMFPERTEDEYLKDYFHSSHRQIFLQQLWSPENLATLREMWESGESCANIAARIKGVSPAEVILQARQLGFARPV